MVADFPSPPDDNDKKTVSGGAGGTGEDEHVVGTKMVTATEKKVATPSHPSSAATSLLRAGLK